MKLRSRDLSFKEIFQWGMARFIIHVQLYIAVSIVECCHSFGYFILLLQYSSICCSVILFSIYPAYSLAS